MPDPLLLRALAASAGLALLTAPLSCFVAWLRLAYFGDAIAHGALLGVALSLLIGADTLWGVAAVAVAMALLLAWMRGRQLAHDTQLGVLSHGALALAMVLVALTGSPVDMQAYLFGDLLAVTEADIALLFAAAFTFAALLAWRWRALMLMALNADIASVEGVRVARLRLMLMLMVALAVALSIKIVGVLLITAMLILPASAARPLARTPEAMALLSTLMGLLASAFGVFFAFHYDTPAGPSIVLAALGLFIVTRLKRA